MLFNSIEFAYFLPVVFLLYWFVFHKKLRLQNLFLLVISYFFYGWWDWHFLLLIAFSSLVDYLVGLQLSKTEVRKKRKFLLFTSVFVNLGFLAFFKYFNFFAENFAEAFTIFGGKMEINTLQIVLPVGISFYTFQTLSYTIDIYRKKLKPTKDWVSFFAFVSFFPQLVAGPIERASNLLPQFFKKRTFSYDQASNGMRQILWGLFKKVVIADNCAEQVNYIFNHSDTLPGGVLLIGTVLFTIQIYGDFSGYSDIAIGTARLFGFNLMRNFANPFFSRNIAEFWRKWHISLTTWFKDYVYIPLGGSQVVLWKQVRNVLIVFLVSGFWHGANWTFIVWGALNALYFLPSLLLKNNTKYNGIVAEGKYFPTLKELFQMGFTFALTAFAFIIFRSENMQQAFSIISELFSLSLFEISNYSRELRLKFVTLLLVVFIIMEWLGREEEFAIEKTGIRWPKILRYSFYYVLVMIIFLFGAKEQTFIYFQF